MFGYVVVNKSELKFKEFDQYRRYYCGLCDCLKKRHGLKGQIALSYDMTFLVLLLTGLYEPENRKGRRGCLVNPWKKKEFLSNVCTDYAADMTVFLVYYKCMDDYRDEKKLSRKLYGAALKRKVRHLKEIYPEKTEKIQEAMEHFAELEAAFSNEKKAGMDREAFTERVEGTACLDNLALAFGHVLGTVFRYSPCASDTAWLDSLEKIGIQIGKFIYIVDAYDDMERDRKKGCFNPFFHHSMGASADALDAWVEDVLRNEIAQAAWEFEKLPVLQDVGILRNILYSGIWNRFYQVKEKRKK